MNHEPFGGESEAAYHDNAPDDDDGVAFEFEQDSDANQVRPRWMKRVIWRALPMVVLTAMLVVVAGHPNLLLHRSLPNASVQITVVCDVPWAIIRVDGRGAGTRCTEGIAGALPMAQLSVNIGQHTLVATAEGFTPYSIYIVAHPSTPGLYLTQFALTPQGTARALDAVNAYFASTYMQDVVFPAALWQVLGLRTPPAGPTLLVRDRFEAIALDGYEPTYSETTYQRPIVPAQGALGVAAVLVEHVTIYDGCSATQLIERRMPVLYKTRASVILSAQPGPHGWTATNPYSLNPVADIYSPPDIAATPATPDGLLVLTARTALADRLGSLSMLAGAITVTPLTSASGWGAGVVLTLLNGSRQAPKIAGARPGAVWLYAGGELVALTSAARELSPNVPAFAASITLAGVRASLANQQSHLCGGE